MALYTISDLHLPIGVDKPMDIFGSKWANYVQRLYNNWKSIVNPEDTVVLPGDFSWATYIEEAIPDFRYIDELPGKKIILKGNHDYWWTTKSKLDKFLGKNAFSSFSFLNNNSYMYKDIAICGTRGWGYLGVGDASDEDKRIYERELGRLELSIADAKNHNPKEIIVFLHYPPITNDISSSGFCEVLKKHGIKRCFYGHIHNASYKNVAEGECDGVRYKLVSCDYKDFVPYKVCD